MLHVALLFGISLTDLLYLTSLYLDHLILHLDLLLVIRSVHWPLAPLPLPVDVAVLGQCHLLLTLNHLVVFVKGDKFSIVALAVLHYLHPPKGT